MKVKHNISDFNRILILSAFCFLVGIPLTALACYALGDTNLYIAAVLMILWAMVPFFADFERRALHAREISMLAVMTALAVVSRTAFFWLPSFKPLGGVVAVTGLALGPQAGFLTGALSMLVSNILFGQGPWTPWQMFCYGLVGFVCGVLGKYRIFSEKHVIRSSVITFLTLMLLSSAILDTCSVFLLRQNQVQSVLAIYLAGIPFNIANATAGALCVFVILKPFMLIMTRLKKKYGC